MTIRRMMAAILALVMSSPVMAWTAVDWPQDISGKLGLPAESPFAMARLYQAESGDTLESISKQLYPQQWGVALVVNLDLNSRKGVEKLGRPNLFPDVVWDGAKPQYSPADIAVKPGETLLIAHPRKVKQAAAPAHRPTTRSAEPKNKVRKAAPKRRAAKPFDPL